MSSPLLVIPLSLSLPPAYLLFERGGESFVSATNIRQFCECIIILSGPHH